MHDLRDPQSSPADTPAGTITGNVNAGAVTVADRARGTWKRVLAIAGAALGVALVGACTGCASEIAAVKDTVAGALGYEPVGTADLADVAAELGRYAEVLAPRARAEAEAAALRERLRAQTDRVVELEAKIEQVRDDHATVLGAVHLDYGTEIERLTAELDEAEAFIALFPASIVAAILAQQALPVDEAAPAPAQ